MMATVRRLAIFVEGDCESLFFRRLVKEVAGRQNVSVRVEKASGGRSVARTTRLIAEDVEANANYYVLIFNSSNDGRVVQDVKDNYSSLVSRGYRRIIAVRDVYPKGVSDIPRLQRAFARVVPVSPIRPRLCFSISECESFFLANTGHYERIHSSLSVSAASGIAGCDLASEDPERIAPAATMLDTIYSSVGRRYTKKIERFSRTIEAIDYTELYVDQRLRQRSLRRILRHLDAFFAA
jgi:hypothetical protein